MTRREGLMLAALLALALLAALPVLTYPPGRDQGEFATIGRGILDGKVPYVDLWNPKPPAVFYVYAAAIRIFGRTPEALRAVDFFIVPALGAALFWLGRRLASARAGFLAAGLFTAFYFSESFWTLTQNDGIAALPMALALICALKAADQTSGWRAAAWACVAGALAAYTIWFKYPFALFALVLLAAWLLLVKPPRTLARLLMSAALGALVVLLAGALLLAALGALEDLIESARVTSQYTALTFNARDFTELMWIGLGYRWQQWGLLWLLAALGLFMRRSSSSRSPAWRIVLIWTGVGLLIMLVQAKGYDYHWLPMLPPLVLMAAGALDHLIGRIPIRFRPAMTAAALGVFLTIMILNIWPRAWLYLTGREAQTEYYGRFQAGEFVADESLEVAALLRERVVPGDSLYIWGFRPEVYFLSQLNPPTRFIFQFPLVADWYPASWREENVEILWAALPPYVLVLQVDYMPWVTGSEEDSNTLLQEYNELNDWLVFNYERETQIGNFLIWRRKT